MTATVEVSVVIRRLDDHSQARLQELMDKNTDGRLAPDERKELERLVAQYEENLIKNAEALVKATYPTGLTSLGRYK